MREKPEPRYVFLANHNDVCHAASQSTRSFALQGIFREICRLSAAHAPSFPTDRPDQDKPSARPRSSCPHVLARTLLTRRAMQEDPRQFSPTNGHSSVRFVRQVKHADDELVTLVSKNPLAVLGIALAIGYVIGRVVARHD